MRIVAAMLFAVMLAQPVLAERRLALVVGNDSYDEVTGLKKAVSDAHAMADALKPLGFEVELVDNASRSAMSRRLVDFERRLQPGDTALFYFAGHGVEIRGENYLLPTDVPNAGEGEEGLVQDTAFAAGDIITRIQNRGAGRVIAILDACRNNPFEPSLGTRALGDGTNGLAGMEAPEGVFVLMSAGARQEALDTLGGNDADPNSIFTRALIQSLETPGLSLVQIAKRTQTEVDRLASQVNHEQTPAYSDNINGDLVLLPAPAAPAPAPVAVASSASDDLAAWRKIESSSLPEDFAAYLDRFGAAAIFAEAARERIATLALAAAPPPAGDAAETRETPDPGVATAGAAPASAEIPLPDSGGDELAFAPDGALVATYGADPGGEGERIRIWSADGTLTQTLTAGPDRVEDVRFSADGSLLAVATRDEVAVWDTRSGDRTIVLKGRQGQGFSSVAFSADGKTIATGNGDGRVRFWSAHDGRPLETYDGPRLSGGRSFRSNLVGFDPDGATVVSAQGDGDWKIRLWERATGRVLRDFELARCAEDCTVRGIRFYDGLIVASVSSDDVFVLDPATGKTVSHFKGRLILLARNGANPAALIASGTTITIHDIATGEVVQEVESPDLASARVESGLKLAARRGPDGAWLLFPVQAGVSASR